MTPSSLRALATGAVLTALAAPAIAQTAPSAAPAAKPAPVAPARTTTPPPPVPPQVDAAFKAWDTDKNGSLSPAEFRAGWARLRQGGAQNVEARLQQQFKHVDANNNGGIDRTEYANLLLIKQAGSAAPAFSEFDRDGSQKLEFGEYTELVRRMAQRRPGAPAQK